MDVAKRYYARLKVNEIKEYKLISSYHRVCKQNNPVQITHLRKNVKSKFYNQDSTVQLLPKDRD